ncbi:acyclic terpene utilization AtuA family protein [Prosthecomicrobium sp. N25]|uniref:acyclic terpene utilization AtuA family protein n=1 Tax=Prosthecomicrobium sp. N25 TaxID=3129254 RepID=UPI0030777460
MSRSMKMICPNGHLGFAPTRPGSFALGVQASPDIIAADSGSDDVGPVPLGSDTSTSPLAWQTHDLELMLLAARARGVPMIIGSAGDTGSNSRVDLYVDIIRSLAAKHGLPPFRLGWFYSEIEKDWLRSRMRSGQTVTGLDARPDLDDAELDATERIVALAGVHPFIKLLDMGADVIIGGRSSDAAIFAAPAIRAGYPEALSYYLGKVLECASFCAEPYGGKETVLGEITDTEVRVTAMHPDQRCTVASVAGHAMYERSNPFFEYVAGGCLDMSECRYEQIGPKTTRVTGPKFVPSDGTRVKLEGSGKIGERYVGLVGIRDPYTIANVDRVIDWAREQARDRFGNADYQLHYTVYGRDGVMGPLDPERDRPAHELCVMVQGIAPTTAMAEEVCMTGTRQMFYARLPDVKGTAGSVAFALDEVMRASPAYRWTLNHTVGLADPLEVFPCHIAQVGA